MGEKEGGGKKLSTKLIHTGDGQVCKEFREHVSVPETFPIYYTSVFAFDDVPSVDAVYEAAGRGYIYSRIAHPNADVVSRIVAAADGAEAALVFSSGMGAITSSILSLVKSGDHFISSSVLYGGVHSFFSGELARFGVDVTFADLAHDDIKPLIRPNTKLIYTETISNPLMEVPDMEALARTARERGLRLVVDNTFATPVVARPLALGADIVLYSATKYLGGHSDIVGGAAAASAPLIEEIRRRQSLYGATMSPPDCWLLARSMRTLDLRVRKQSENAIAVARFLESHPKVERVFYPGLPSSESHERAVRQFEGDGDAKRYGGMLSVDVKGGERGASAVIEGLRMIFFVPSLAGTATTVSYSAKTSHRAYAPEERERLGITPGQLRFSIGIEDAGDIIADISDALDKI
ncbi:MAG: aminotransferase class I/II-fold pyridoxal phosphate-dependent enzyme [Synergistaceae bacterium]|jgi:methionine-gamma-lyase|nr:aminotransferase class I/II-fold pyridoxal phosphate-dependent enzyme [Synergistaceae bacterium]